MDIKKTQTQIHHDIISHVTKDESVSKSSRILKETLVFIPIYQTGPAVVVIDL